MLRVGLINHICDTVRLRVCPDSGSVPVRRYGKQRGGSSWVEQRRFYRRRQAGSTPVRPTRPSFAICATMNAMRSSFPTTIGTGWGRRSVGTSSAKRLLRPGYDRCDHVGSFWGPRRSARGRHNLKRSFAVCIATVPNFPGSRTRFPKE